MGQNYVSNSQLLLERRGIMIMVIRLVASTFHNQGAFLYSVSQLRACCLLLLLFSCSVASDSFATPWTIARQALLSMGFSWQEYWSGLPCPSPRDLLNPGTEPTSLVSPELAGRFCTTEPPGKPLITIHFYINEIILYIIFFILTLSPNNMIQSVSHPDTH